ncbi:hypothetical protein [Thiofaba sp. EF100]|uniref:hypothetical protein n=1 Tax=Thiofaba sp. EF100 TaxID=3121274 RepID=UPI003221E234
MNLFRRRQDLLGPLLLMLNAGLAFVLWWEWGATAPDIPAPLGRPSPAREDPPAAQFALPPLESYAQTVARPLFNMSRRPEEEDAGVKTAEGVFTLTGVVITASGRREALLVPRGGRGVTRGGVGDWVDGWRIELIEPERVVLRRGPKEMPLVLERPSKGGAQPGSTAPLPPPKTPLAAPAGG